MSALPERPDILWITSEDNSPFWLGCYGNEQARTPNLDRLAAEGVLFERAYANAPVCAVARSTILMGAHAVSMGTQHMRSRYLVPQRFVPHATLLRSAGYVCRNPGKTDYNILMDDRAIWDHPDPGVPGSLEGDSPRFSIVNIGVTHESSLFRRAPMEPKRLDPEEIDLPGYLPDLPEIRKDFARYHDRIDKLDRQVGIILEKLEQSGRAENTIVFYYADHGGPMPRGKRYLKETGVRVPLIVRFPEKWKHLSPFKPGERTRELVSFVDLAPTLLSLAGIEETPAMQGRAFLGSRREAPPERPLVFLYGDRFDEFYGMRRGITDGRWKYIRRFLPQCPAAPYSSYQFSMPSWQAWRRAWKQGEGDGTRNAIWEAPQPVEELYDLQSDPWETVNLAPEADHRELLKRMRSELRETMAACRDSGLVPEPMFSSFSEGEAVADVLEHRRSDYLDWLELAFLPTREDRDLGHLEANLESEDPVRRYWACVGLRTLGEDARIAGSSLDAVLQDREAVVRSMAAEAVAALGQRERARDVLLSQLREPLSELRQLNVLNTLFRVEMLGEVPADWSAKGRKAGLHNGPVQRFVRAWLR